jgi:hypothetical protein
MTDTGTRRKIIEIHDQDDAVRAHAATWQEATHDV